MSLAIVTIVTLLFLALNSYSSYAEEKWSPWVYDLNDDNVIDIEENIRVVNHYEFNEISKENAIEVVKIYFETAPNVGKV